MTGVLWGCLVVAGLQVLLGLWYACFCSSFRRGFNLLLV